MEQKSRLRSVTSVHDWKMKDLRKSSGVSRTPHVANHRQVKSSSKDRLSRVRVKSNMSRSNVPLPKNYLAWYVPYKANPPKEKILPVPHIKWKCPPKFALNTDWRIAAAEESHEVVAERCRETTVLEEVYADITAIPPTPFATSQMEHECSGDSQTPVIPLEEVEEAAWESPIDLFRLDILCGLQRSDLQIATAAAAFVNEVRKNGGQIDGEMFIKIFTHPEIVKKLIDGNELAKPENGTPPAPEPDTSLPLPSSTTAPVVDELDTRCSEPLSRAIPFAPHTANQSLVLPCSNVETEINKSSSKRGVIQTGSGIIHTSNQETNLISPLRSHSDVALAKSLTSEPGRSAHAHTHQIGRGKEVRPPMPCSLRLDEETIDELIKKYGAPDITGPSTSNPRKEEIKKLIHAYGAHDATGVKTVAPLIASTSRPPIMEEREKTINKYAMPGHGLMNPFMGPSPSLLASTPLPPTTNLHVLHHALESSFTPTPISNLHFPLSSPVTILAPKADGEYHMFGIMQHNNTTSIMMNPRYQKPCIYYGSSKGCRNGYNCQYRHEVPEHSRAMGEAEVPVATRMKFT